MKPALADCLTGTLGANSKGIPETARKWRISEYLNYHQILGDDLEETHPHVGHECLSWQDKCPNDSWVIRKKTSSSTATTWLVWIWVITRGPVWHEQCWLKSVPASSRQTRASCTMNMHEYSENEVHTGVHDVGQVCINFVLGSSINILHSGRRVHCISEAANGWCSSVITIVMYAVAWVSEEREDT